ncbi:MAG: 3'-5' exoribonuclease [Reyranellaceae bacterium]
MAQKRPDLTYVVIDIETDGMLPGRNSMMSLAAVAADESGGGLGEFTANLAPLPDAAPDPNTLSWWWTQPEAWAAATREQELPEVVVARFVNWVKALPGDKTIVCHPLLFDGPWLDYYLERFLGLRLFPPPGREERLFVEGGIDVATFAMAALNRDLRDCRKSAMPERFQPATPHTHLALEDARGHAEVFFGLLRHVRGAARAA